MKIPAWQTQPGHLYLVRHGRTALNAEGRLRGLANPSLDEVGRAEADRVAGALAQHQPCIVVSSPLDRAIQTARSIASASGLSANPDSRLNDRDYGRWSGHSKSEVIGEWGSVDDAPGVEPLSDVLNRARPALDSLLDHNGAEADRPIVVVTHDAVIRALITSIDPTRTDLAQPTGCWNHLTRINGTWSVLEVDQIPGTSNR